MAKRSEERPDRRRGGDRRWGLRRGGDRRAARTTAAPPAPAGPAPAWWGRVEVPAGEARLWRIGPLRLHALRTEREWRVSTARGDDALDPSCEAAVPVAPEDVPEGAETLRWAFGSTPAELELAPRLADRPMIVRPSETLLLPAGEEIVLYVSTPLWAALTTGHPPVAIGEVPCYRPSDTWFGSSTLAGELAYASRTAARHRLEDVPLLPHRAVTALRVRNLARDPLSIERMRVPVEFLTLYRTPRGLWTQTATLVREHAGELAALQLGKGPPAEAGGGERLAGPRNAADGNIAMRAFSRLLRLGGGLAP